MSQPLNEIQNYGTHKSQASSKSSSRSASITTTASFDSNASYGLSARNENLPSWSSEETRRADTSQLSNSSSVKLQQHAEIPASGEDGRQAAVDRPNDSGEESSPVTGASSMLEQSDVTPKQELEIQNDGEALGCPSPVTPAVDSASVLRTTSTASSTGTSSQISEVLTPQAEHPEQGAQVTSTVSSAGTLSQQTTGPLNPRGEQPAGLPEFGAQAADDPDEAGCSSSAIYLLMDEYNPVHVVEALLAPSSSAASQEEPAAAAALPAESSQQPKQIAVNKCQLCEFQTPGRKRLEDHLVLKHGLPPSPRAFCYDCNAQFATIRQCDTHRLRNHRPEVSRCPYCCKVYVREEYFVNHINMHVNEATCHNCQHVYCSPSSFRLHQTSRKHQTNAANNTA